MRRVTFYKNNRSKNLLHIETEGCIVNIRVNLFTPDGAVTSVEVVPDRYGPEHITKYKGNQIRVIPVKNGG